MTQLTFFEDDKKHEPNKWIPSRAEALAKMQAFIPKAGRAYATSRNYDFGHSKHGSVSTLSPWVRHRTLLEEEILRAVLKSHSLVGAEKFIQEVFWRGYFKGWLEQRPEVWKQYRRDVSELSVQVASNPALDHQLKSAISGETGIDCFDAWVQELIETGYLHNHARMWFASIWMFTLKLPWQLGADFFYRHLLDGDSASNTLSWRWVGGLHTKGKHYLARPSNIEKFTDGRFSPNGLVLDAGPLQEDRVFDLAPAPIGDKQPFGQSFGILITEEDFSPESLPVIGNPAAIMGLSVSQHRSPFATGKCAVDFEQRAMADALQRAGAHFQLNTTLGDHEDWSAALLKWAEESNVKTIVTAFAPVGPVQEQLLMAKPKLAAADISLVQILRNYDKLVWPHATAGFFKLKKEIPALIGALALS